MTKRAKVVFTAEFVTEIVYDTDEERDEFMAGVTVDTAFYGSNWELDDSYCDIEWEEDETSEQ